MPSDYCVNEKLIRFYAGLQIDLACIFVAVISYKTSLIWRSIQLIQTV